MKKESRVKVGDRIESDSCGWYTIIEKKDGYSVVEFDTGYTTTVGNGCANKGRVKDPLFPQVLGVGYFGIGPYVSRLGTQSQGYLSLPEYNAWINMLQRCYYNRYESRVQGCITYEDIEVDPVWHNFQSFAEWYIPRRKLFDEYNVKRPALDKDILAIKDKPKVYSPCTCCLVPMAINNTLIGIDKEESGIVKSPNGYYYLVQKAKRISDYIYDLDEIKELRKTYKQENLQSLANKYKHVIEPKVYEKLCNWFES